jgi:SAM-dependent methyltransferase
MGLTLIRTALFQRMLDAGVVHGDGTDLDDEPFYLTQASEERIGNACMRRQSTEDLYFYAKARKVDCRILVDTSVLAGHYDKSSGIIYGLPTNYGPALRAKWLLKKGSPSRDREEADKLGLKLALDIGAGSERREWEGHITYTTDIRPDTNPDYVQDTRLLNLPDNHFDLVASSHHLEHLGRYDQETVWQEMTRILRPGGKMEHMVPNLEWAAAKITQGECDEHVLNILYGAQEAHGYKREFNLHYFGYTPAIAEALAISCGLVNVRTESYKERPELGYNLLVYAEKPPEPKKAEAEVTDGEGPVGNIADELPTAISGEELAPAAAA